MQDTFKNILKNGTILFVVGVVLAAVAPLISMTLGLAPEGADYSAAAAALGDSASPLWMGAFFGTFGAIDAAVRPVVERWFDKREENAAASALSKKLVGDVNLTMVNPPQPSLELVSTDNKFQQSLQAQRTSEASETLEVC